DYFDSPASSCFGRPQRQALRLAKLGTEPLLEKCGAEAAPVEKASWAKTFLGWFASMSRHTALPVIHATATARASNVPRKTMSRRGGYDLLSGRLAGSSTFTVGSSLTSSTFAISYSLVRASRTAS